MGIDATLYVLASYGPYTIASFRLNRDYDLYNLIEQDLTPLGCPFQLPNGSWCGFSDGSRPDGCEDTELGYLSKDSYGTPIRWKLGRDLPDPSTTAHLNAAVLSFVREHYPNNKVVAFFH